MVQHKEDCDFDDRVRRRFQGEIRLNHRYTRYSSSVSRIPRQQRHRVLRDSTLPDWIWSWALFAGPLSEAFGRNQIYITTFPLFCIWIMASALAPNIGAHLVFRFFAGLSGSTPLTTAGGTLADLLNGEQRGKLFPYFAYVAFVGPMLSPVIGGYVGQSGISWRWTEWITLINLGAILAIIALLVPEAYAPVILRWKAHPLRAINNNQAYKTPIELTRVSFAAKLKTALSRPFVTLFTEPIIVLFNGYLTLVYVVAFSFLTSYPFVFGDTYSFPQESTYLMFLGIVVGLTVCIAASPLFSLLFKRESAKPTANGQAHPPSKAMLWCSTLPLGASGRGACFERCPHDLSSDSGRPLPLSPFPLLPSSLTNNPQLLPLRHLLPPNLHLNLHVHHPVVPAICRVGAGIHHVRAVHRRRHHGSRLDPHVSQSGRPSV